MHTELICMSLPCEVCNVIKDNLRVTRIDPTKGNSFCKSESSRYIHCMKFFVCKAWEKNMPCTTCTYFYKMGHYGNYDVHAVPCGASSNTIKSLADFGNGPNV